MTSRERLLNTIHRRPTDRVPISLYELCQFEGSSYAWFANQEPSYANLMKVMSEKTDCIMQTEASIRYPEIEKITETETWREGESTFCRTTLHTPKGNLTSLCRTDDNIFTTWTLEHFLKEPEDIEKYQSLNFTCMVDNTHMLDDQRRVGEGGIICPSVRDPLCRGAELFAMEDFLVFALTEPEESKKFLDFLWELTRFELQGMLKGNVQDVMFRIVGPEYATPPYMSTDYYYDLVTCYIEKMVPMIHEAGAISRVHSHGKVRHALSEFAKTDLMCVDPVEPIPDGDISLAEVKKLYGDRMTILGNIELKELENSSSERIEFLVKEAMDSAKQGGGFILMPTATPINIPLNPKTEQNIITMIEAGLYYGRY